MPRPKPKGRVSEISFRVRYAETDAMGIVHHSHYVPWFEVGRIHFLDDAGLPYRKIEEMGYLFLITDLGIRYLRPARFHDLVTVRTWIDKVGSRGMRLEYEIVDEERLTLVTGHTSFICADKQGCPTRFPAEVFAALDAFGQMDDGADK